MTKGKGLWGPTNLYVLRMSQPTCMLLIVQIGPSKRHTASVQCQKPLLRQTDYVACSKYHTEIIKQLLTNVACNILSYEVHHLVAECRWALLHQSISVASTLMSPLLACTGAGTSINAAFAAPAAAPAPTALLRLLLVRLLHVLLSLLPVSASLLKPRQAPAWPSGAVAGPKAASWS